MRKGHILSFLKFSASERLFLKKMTVEPSPKRCLAADYPILIIFNFRT
nr:MAG TPA: trcl Probable zinc-ribbon domain [Herelleviridae sp.]